MTADVIRSSSVLKNDLLFWDTEAIKYRVQLWRMLDMCFNVLFTGNVLTFVPFVLRGLLLAHRARCPGWNTTPVFRVGLVSGFGQLCELPGLFNLSALRHGIGHRAQGPQYLRGQQGAENKEASPGMGDQRDSCLPQRAARSHSEAPGTYSLSFSKCTVFYFCQVGISHPRDA